MSEVPLCPTIPYTDRHTLLHKVAILRPKYGRKTRYGGDTKYGGNTEHHGNTRYGVITNYGGTPKYGGNTKYGGNEAGGNTSEIRRLASNGNAPTNQGSAVPRHHQPSE